MIETDTTETKPERPAKAAPKQPVAPKLDGEPMRLLRLRSDITLHVPGAKIDGHSAKADDQTTIHWERDNRRYVVRWTPRAGAGGTPYTVYIHETWACAEPV